MARSLSERRRKYIYTNGCKINLMINQKLGSFDTIGIVGLINHG